MLNRRNFITQSMLASASLSVAGTTADDPTIKKPSSSLKQASAFPIGKIGKNTFSRLIAGGNLLSGWCHQRDLLFVRKLAEAYLTEEKQFNTLQMLEERGVNAILIDQMQIDTVKKYHKQRGGKMQIIAAIRQGWGDWSKPNWSDLKNQIDLALERAPATVFIHGGYADRQVQSDTKAGLDILGKAVQYIREQGLSAGLGAHALEVPRTCSAHGIEPDYYVKTFHHDRYWSATPKNRRKPFSVDGPRSLDHNEFHDNIFCLDAEGTAEFMLDKTQPWIAIKVLAAGAIQPKSGFQYAFENGADFIAVGMFDFEVEEDTQTAIQVLQGLQRERPWRG